MKNLFLLDPGITFLNHGSFGACPVPVFDEFQRWQRELERNPVEFLGRRSAALLRQARAALAAYLGADVEHLVFVPNATTGVNIVARSLDLAPGDEILTTDHEYGACIATFERLCAARGARLVKVPIPLPFDSARFADQLLAGLTPRTRLVFTSHVTSTTALIFPVAELAARSPVPVLIDGAHAPGQIDVALDAIGAAFYTGNCHKWLCAPKGAAFLHARPEHHATLHATVTSWGYAEGVEGHTGFDAYLGRSLLERRLQWQGTRDPSACLAVPAAVDFVQRHHGAAMRERCHALAMQAVERLASRFALEPIGGGADHAQMGPIPVPPCDAAALKRQLFDEHRIEVPVTQHAGRTFVRVSVQSYNEPAEVEQLYEVLSRWNWPGEDQSAAKQ